MAANTLPASSTASKTKRPMLREFLNKNLAAILQPPFYSRDIQIKTQVAIIGAGPAGLFLAHLLRLEKIDSVVIEARSRRYCEERIRAGVLEHATAELLIATGVGERMQRQGLIHHGLELRFEGRGHRIDFAGLTGRSITVYGQHEVVKDLIQARLNADGPLFFETSGVTLHNFGPRDSAQPSIHFAHGGEGHEIHCDFIAGCDGFHGISRPAIPPGVLATFEKEYPFGWLGILAEAAPASEELIYANHERGFALMSMRSPSITRLYLQCAPDEDPDQWPDQRIWTELQQRMALRSGFRLNEGNIIQRGVTAMRSFVAEPMQYGKLFLAGDAAHIVPPTGAKGMNLAVADVRVLSHALADHYNNGKDSGLENYSAICLDRVWRAQHFSWWMTSMLHRSDGDAAFDHKRQLAELRQITTSRHAATVLAQNYCGLPLP